MAKDPAVLFYTSDFLSGVSFMSYEDRGKYITLLCLQHQKGGIPENHMISVCGSLDSPVIKNFVKTDGFYHNIRMKEESEKRAKYCESRGSNKKGHVKNKIISKSYENHMENENINEDDNIKALKNNKAKRFMVPTVDEISSYCKLRKNSINAESFFDYYETRGWKLKGGVSMKDWKAAVRTWEKNSEPSIGSKKNFI